MATATETLTGLVSVSQGSTTSPGTTYTVPAGKYAEVYIHEIFIQLNPGRVDIGNVRIKAGTGSSMTYYGIQTTSQYESLFSSNNVRTVGNGPILLNEGQTISHNAGVGNSVSYDMLVKEFNKP